MACSSCSSQLAPGSATAQLVHVPAGWAGAVLTLARTVMPGVSCTGRRSGAVVIPQCVGGSPGPTDSEMPGASSALNHSASAFAVPRSRTGSSVSACVRRLRLLERDQAGVCRPQPARLGAPVTGREVAEGAGIEDLVDGHLGQVIELEAVRVVPQELHHLPAVPVVHQRGPGRHQAGDHDSARLEPAVTGGDDRTEHPFVDPEPSEPLRDDHIDPSRQLDLHDIAVEHLDDLRGPVRGGQPLRHGSDRGPLHRVDARSPGPRREQTQDAASRPDVEHDVTGAHHRLDRTPEGLGANTVADHRPVHFKLRIHRVRRVPDRRSHACILMTAAVLTSHARGRVCWAE